VLPSQPCQITEDKAVCVVCMKRVDNVAVFYSWKRRATSHIFHSSKLSASRNLKRLDKTRSRSWYHRSTHTHEQAEGCAWKIRHWDVEPSFACAIWRK